MAVLRYFLFLISPSLLAQSVWINEIHYDNVGSDQNEGIEVVVDTLTWNWREIYLQAYNGFDSASYGAERSLLQADSVSETASFKLFWLSYPSLQNGPRDGLALFRRSIKGDSVIQFISYEGALRALNGVASGMFSQDIGVQESSSTPLGTSLQLAGSGFAWQDFYFNSAVASPAFQNLNQQLNPLSQRASNEAHFTLENSIKPTFDYQRARASGDTSLLLSQFYLHDALGVDSDTLATHCRSMEFLIHHPEILQELSLWQGNSKIAEIHFPSEQIVFSNLNLRADDDDSLSLSLKAKFRSLQNDGRSLGLYLQKAESAPQSSTFYSDRLELVDSNLIKVQVKADQFQVINFPDSAFRFSYLPKLTVNAIDSSGNIDVDFADTLNYYWQGRQDTLALVFHLGRADLSTKQMLALNSRETAVLEGGGLDQWQDSVWVRSLNFYSALLISGIFDGPLAWGRPKGLELYALRDIPNLSHYAVGVANNGGGSDGPEVILRPGPLEAGSYYYLSLDSASFHDFFAFSADSSAGLLNFNGDDAVEIFYDSTGLFQHDHYLVDRFGNTDQVQTDWNYSDAWAYRKSGAPDTVFDSQDWYFSQSGGFQGSLNQLCQQPFPLQSFNLNPWPADFYYQDHLWYPYSPHGDLSKQSLWVAHGRLRISEDLKARTLTIAPLASVQVDSLVGLELVESLELEGVLEIKDQASLLIHDTLSTAAGTVSVDRWIKVPDFRRYSFWSAPLADQSVSKVFGLLSANPVNLLDFYKWNTISQYWQSLGDTSYLLPSQGFVSTPGINHRLGAYIHEKRSFVGSRFNLDFRAYFPHQKDQDILIGNPYTAPISAKAFFAANPSLNEQFYLWDNQVLAANQAYAIWHPLASLPVIAGARSPDSLIPVGQGFFVRANQVGDSLIFRTSMQRSTPMSLFKSMQESPFILSIHCDSLQSQMALCFRATASIEYKAEEDVEFFDAASALAINTKVEGRNLSLDTRPLERDTLDLHLRLAQGKHRVELQTPTDQKGQFFLRDRQADRLVDLSKSSYQFFCDSLSSGEDRFELILNPTAMRIPTIAKPLIQFYQKGQRLFWQSSHSLESLKIFSLSAQPVLHFSAAQIDSNLGLDLRGLKPAIYLLSYRSEGYRYSQLFHYQSKP